MSISNRIRKLTGFFLYMPLAVGVIVCPNPAVS